MALARRALGVTVVDGTGRLGIDVLNTPIRATHLEGPLASFHVTPEAWRVSHMGNETFAWLTQPVPHEMAESVVFIFKMATGYGSSWVHPSGEFRLYVNERHAITFRETKYSERFTKGPCVLAYDVHRTEVAPEGMSLNLDAATTHERMASFGVAALLVPAAWLEPGQPALLRVVSHSEYPSPTWWRLDLAYKQADYMRHLNWWPAVELAASPPAPLSNGRSPVFFGEVHAHSEIDSDGSRTLDENFGHARHTACVDFYAHTDHDDAIMKGDKWHLRLDAVRRWHDEGRFVTIPAYEFTSFVYGHRNVYFRDPEHAPFFSCRTPDQQWIHPRELYAHLDRHGADVVVIPHHPVVADHPFNWKTSNPKYDRLVEIFSGWGCHETADANAPLIGHGSDKYPQLSITNALRSGHILGFVCGADAHDGYPGNAQGKFPYNWMNKHSPVGSGRTAVLAEQLSRDAVWQALYDRRCYGTTGTRILVDFTVNDAPMGSQVTAAGERTIRFRVAGPCPIHKIHVIRNGELLARAWCDQPVETGEFHDPGSGAEVDFYYLRVFCQDGEMAWASPIWVRRAGRRPPDW
ncbi:CehA/McbA family metallohydrolase [Litorilinea aerophila]|uniref:CehA/McbA family metallohydrolase n=1 Tax=Litorilinea aerophila TaxID=1204385 RepID=UPI001E3EE7EF|nr:CehA/McbA family metallohydrolase [Litorilinea aerophila]